MSALPAWVEGFLNRRTAVEHALRAPLLARRKGQPEPEPLTAEDLWALADRLSVPEEFSVGGMTASLPERDTDRPSAEQGLFRKFVVRRVDGSDAPGGRHDGCRYFVLDVDHDPHAMAALTAYAAACEQSHPQLAADLRTNWGASPVSERAAALDEAVAAVAMEDRSGRDWVPGSLWDKLTTEAVARIRALGRVAK